MLTKFVKWHKHSELETIAYKIYQPLNCPIPIDIDYIVEKHGIELDDLYRLKEDFGLYGFLAKINNKFTIFVQRGDLKLTNYHANTTIAEEFAHYILHERYFRNVNNFQEAYEFYAKISNKSEMIMELNAKYLASAILIPLEDVKERAMGFYTVHKHIFKDILKDDYGLIIESAAKDFSDIYRVPEGWISYRLRNPAVGFKEFLKSESQG